MTFEDPKSESKDVNEPKSRPEIVAELVSPQE